MADLADAVRSWKMNSDESPVEPKHRPIPRREEREDGSTVMKWHLRTAHAFEVHQWVQVAAQVSNDTISLHVDQVKDEVVVISVKSGRQVPYSAVWDFSIRCLLIIERRLGELVAIEGTDRDEWRYQFVVAEHCGTFAEDKTQLMIAAETGDVERVRSILETNAKLAIDDMTPFGLSALGYAAMKGHVQAVRLLLNAGAKSVSGGELTTLQAGLLGGVEIIQSLLDAGTDVNCRNRYGETALMTASAIGRVEIVQELLEHGADPSIKDKTSATAIDRARKNHRTEVLDALKRTYRST